MERSKVLGATELYWREGVQTLSLNEVCRQVSVSKPSIYRGLEERTVWWMRSWGITAMR